LGFEATINPSTDFEIDWTFNRWFYTETFFCYAG